MQTIETRYHGPTDTKSSRVSATASGGAGRVMLTWDNARGSEDNHAAACAALMRKMNWRGTMQGGHTKRGMVWVFLDKPIQVRIPAN